MVASGEKKSNQTRIAMFGKRQGYANRNIKSGRAL